ncbi:MAG: hypothetical protein COT84_06840 [Chlamydiae bacterium CG10_big_fil_rev_8_21_14_0_10_35_9]|nr:MAG: hypothetical protein COT84_06840 [Chlamydiae bacterium CG10_big_fil_rev_8_21_14_0_10_35_9]
MIKKTKGNNVMSSPINLSTSPEDVIQTIAEHADLLEASKLYHASGLTEKAEKVLELFQNTIPDCRDNRTKVDKFIALAVAWGQLGNNEQANQCLSDAQGIITNAFKFKSYAFISLAKGFIEIGDFAKALELFQSSINNSEDDEELLQKISITLRDILDNHADLEDSIKNQYVAFLTEVESKIE